MKLKIIILAIVTLAITSCKGQPSKNIQTIEAVAFSKAIQATPNPQVVDVRTPEEFASGHLIQAQNVNWMNPDFVANSAKYDKSKPIFVYCKSGGRSHKAAEKLAELGFTNVIEMEGGILKWDAAGLSKPSEKWIGISQKEYADLLNSDKKVLIDFYAEWCAPCKKIRAFIPEMQNEYKGKLKVVLINYDENPKLVKALGVTGIPYLKVITAKGTTILQDFHSKEEILAILNK
jgi:rhodanese-related sulfurtransferase